MTDRWRICTEVTAKGRYFGSSGRQISPKGRPRGPRHLEEQNEIGARIEESASHLFALQPPWNPLPSFHLSSLGRL
jgi:hypothetical protein